MAFVVSGCNSSEKADQKMVCYLNENSEAGVYIDLIYTDYNSESMIVDNSIVSKEYSDLIKNEENNSIVKELSDRQSQYFETEGINIEFEVDETSLSYVEFWDYNKLNFKDATDVDEKQAMLMDDNYYSAEKIRDYYMGKGYSCDMNSDMEYEAKE